MLYYYSALVQPCTARRTAVTSWSSSFNPLGCQCRSPRRVFTGTSCSIDPWPPEAPAGPSSVTLMCFRELLTTVELRPDVPSGLGVLLIHRWPRGVYVDPFQLATLSQQSHWQVNPDSGHAHAAAHVAHAVHQCTCPPSVRCHWTRPLTWRRPPTRLRGLSPVCIPPWTVPQSEWRFPFTSATTSHVTTERRLQLWR